MASSSQPPISDLPLPAGYRALGVLSAGDQGRVLHAERDGVPLVLRLLPESDGRASALELEVLAAVRHPGLAELLDFGSLPDGCAWIARAWIEGRTLGDLAPELSPSQRAGLLARLTPGLDALHRRGFVHADLKPGNVIVRPDGEPVLTDFGLARRAGGGGPAAGSLFYVAPEALLGLPVDPRADLFALGVMLHEALGGRRAPASAFYGQFPQVDFLTAAGSSLEDLPEWSRELVASLLERDPARRPTSALEVGRRIASRLGLESPGGAPRVELSLPPLLGREAWARREFAAAAGSGARAWRLCAGEDARALAGALRLAHTLEGGRTALADPGARSDPAGAGEGLDAWAQRALEGAPNATWIVPLAAGEPWQVRAAEYLARAWSQRPSEVRGGGFVLLAPPEARLDPELWSETPFPPLQPGALERWCEANLEAGGRDIERLAAAWAQASGGAVARVSTALERAAAQGLLAAGEERVRVRGDLAAFERAIVGDTSAPRTFDPPIDPATRELGALLVLAGGELASSDAAQVLAVDPQRLGASVAELASLGVLTPRRVEGDLVLVARPGSGAGLGALVEEPHRRQLSLGLAAQLEARGASAATWLALRVRALPETDSIAGVVEEASRLRERGSAEHALQLVEDARAALTAAGAPPASELELELGEAWVALGYPERAAEPARRLEDLGGPRERALAERLRGRIAIQRGNLDLALEHLAHAVELDPASRDAALHARALALFQARRDGELDRLFADVDLEHLAPRLAGNLRAIHALSRFRRGEVEEARAMLSAELARTIGKPDRQAEAMTRLNLATVLRRTGDTAAACAELEKAAELFDSAGHLPGLAQARALLAGALRDRGEARRAEPLLLSAIALRERLGDRPGADAARGMYGLLCAEQGRVRAALEELASVTASFERAGRSTDAALARARTAELRARLGEAPAQSGEARRRESERALDADPRILVARARTAWLAGDPSGAAEYARRAVDLAFRLGLTEPLEESRLLLALLTAPPGSKEELPRDLVTPRVREDRELLDCLAAPELDPTAALERARELLARGRFDRAARLGIAIVARCSEIDTRRAAAALAEEALEPCERGLTEAQRRSARSALLGVPEPFPQDIEGFVRARSTEEGIEMDVLALIDINRKLVRQEDLAALLGTIVESAIAVTGAERGFLVLEEHGALAFDTARDSRRGAIEEPELEVSRSILEQALSTLRPVRISNAVEDPLLGGSASIAALELRSILCVPLEVEEGLRGAIYVDHRIRAGAFAERAERLLSLLADQAALAIRQVRRFEEIQGLNARLAQRVAVSEADLAAARRELARAGSVVPASGLVGSSEPIQRIHRLIERFAPASLAVLVTGQSGTGKELVARALHAFSPRAAGPFVSENCAALPPTLIEAELFGYRKGAFTGAEGDRAGIFERAHGGTLFLDEIGELAPELQAKLLRVLETGEVRRLGDSRVTTVDVRLVAATNRDLTDEVRSGRFRSDLYYRLDALRIELPPLSARVTDIPDLAQHFLALENARHGAHKHLTPAVLSALCRRDWPGNVRELANEIARLWVLSESDLSDPTLVRSARDTRAPDSASSTLDLVRPLADLERAAIEAALEQTGGDKRRAATLLGISRAKIYQRLQEWRQPSSGEDLTPELQ